MMVTSLTSSSTRPRAWSRKASAGAVFAVVLAIVSAPTARAQAPLADWLTRADPHVQDIHKAENAVFAVIEAPGSIDGDKLRASCAALHGANEALRGVMPAPDPKLTVEVQQAIDNFDSALQSCNEAFDTGRLSKEFVFYLESAEQHFSGADTILVGLAQAG